MTVLQSENVADIIERAFGWAEHKARFTSLEDGSEDARRARMIYDARRRNVLEGMDWNFCRHRVVTGQVSGAVTPHDMPYAYSVPPACLRMRRVEASGYPLKWRREANVYTTAGDGVQLVYTRDETNPALFAPAFVMCLEYLMAAQFAMIYSRSVNRSNQMLENYRRAMTEADQIEGVERSNDDAYERSELDLILSTDAFEKPF